MSHLRRALLAITTAAVALASTLLAPSVAAARDSAEIRVRVLSPDGRPVAGVFAVAMDQFEQRTDADGRAVFRDLDPFTTVFACATLDASTQHLAGPTGWAPACQSAPVVDGIGRVTVRFTVGAAVGGSVFDARTGGPAAGLTVRTLDEDNSPVVVAADAKGRWVIPNLPAGSRSFLAAGSRAAFPDAPHGYADTELLAPDRSIVLRAGQITEIGLRRIAPLVRIDGTVVDTAGAPVNGNGTVFAGNVDGDPSTPFGPTLDRVSGTNQDGVFAAFVPYTRSPRRLVCATGPANSDHPTGLALQCSTSTEAGLTVTRSFTLTEGGAVAGKVRGPGIAGGTIARVAVRTQGEDVDLTAFTRANRTNYRIDGVPAGTRTVVVTPQDPAFPARSSSPVTVAAGSVTTVATITLPAGS